MRWTVAGETAGFAVAAVVAVSVTTAVATPSLAYVLVVLGGAVEGGLLGLGQSIGFGRLGIPVPRGRWIAATSAAAALAWSIGMLPSSLPAVDWSRRLTWVVAAALAVVLLLSIPVAQWLVLRRVVDAAGVWIGLNVAGWGLGLFWTFAPSPLIDESTPVGLLVLAYVLAGLAMATTVALVTGWGVLRFRLRPGVRPAPGQRSGERSAARGHDPAASVAGGATEQAGPVVVGIDGGPEDYQRALRVAAEIALARGAGLKLVHGCRPHRRLPQTEPAPSEQRRAKLGRQQTKMAAKRLCALVPGGTPIAVRLSAGTGMEALIEESAAATAIVLQRRDLSRLRRISTGSTTSAVASRADCPVVVVRAAAPGDADGDVVVGVDAAGPADRAVAAAFAEAEARACGLTAVHVWRWQQSPLDFGHLSPDPDAVADFEQLPRLRLAEAVAGHAAGHPDVRVRQVLVPGEVTKALVQASSSARLLVIGRHGVEPDGPALGRVAKHCLDHAHCPVMVVPAGRPPRPAPYAPGDRRDSQEWPHTARLV